jgi:hypothetical protein
MLVTIDKSRFPIILLTFQPVESTDKNVEDYLNEHLKLLQETPEKLFLIYDLNQGKYMSMDRRVRMARWAEKHSSLFKEKVMGLANVNTSVLANIVMKGFLLLIPVHMRPTMFTKISHALQYAEEVLEKNMSHI